MSWVHYRKRSSIAHSLSLSSKHRPDMTEILLKRTYNRKSSIHPSWLHCPGNVPVDAFESVIKLFFFLSGTINIEFCVT